MKSKPTIISYLFSAGLILATIGCTTGNHHKNAQKMSTTEQTPIFPKGNPQPSEYFTGAAFLYPLLSRDKNNDFVLGSVTFEPGARTLWHTHPRGQVLIVIEGEGIYQERGKPARHLKKGDVVNIPENVEHWHGATAHSKFVHIAITNYKGEQNVVWLQPVSEAEYEAANKQ
jgi:quercetin dioxygenase-like cupin family protein